MAELRVFDDAERLGEAMAAEILDAYASTTEPFLLGCPGGRGLRTTYRTLAAAHTDLSRLVIVMMDEYVENGRAAPADAHYSCRGFALREIAAPLGLPESSVWLPDPSDPDAYDGRIATAGGVDLFLLASGASDGHVAFVPPGSAREGRTAVIELAESTRRDNLATFPEFTSLEEVPRHGVSIGLGTISRLAHRVRLVLHGTNKRVATRRVLALDRFDPDWPASIVHQCANAEIWVDRAALGEAAA